MEQIIGVFNLSSIQVVTRGGKQTHQLALNAPDDRVAAKLDAANLPHAFHVTVSNIIGLEPGTHYEFTLQPKWIRIPTDGGNTSSFVKMTLVNIKKI